MLKLFGSCLIISAFGIWGFLKSAGLKKRNENLLCIISALTLLENEISYGKKGLREALLSIGNAEKLPLFISVSENIGTFSIQNAFETAISKCDMSLTKSDQMVLLEFSQSLGTLETSAQISSILHTKELLQIARLEAYDEYKKYGRLYRNIGLLLGVLVCLILF